MKTKEQFVSSIKRLKADLQVKKYVSESVDTEQCNQGTKDGISFDDALSSIGNIKLLKKLIVISFLIRHLNLISVKKILYN